EDQRVGRVEAVENPKLRPRLEVVVQPKVSVLYWGDNVRLTCVVTGWTRHAIEHSHLRVGFYVGHRTTIFLLDDDQDE
ncbi:MAG: immunoglobulin domain-containing protein, partial [Pirellula sp.]|nr:immunoglobulin domain-containing protein [Pirellula sp.]